MPDFSSFFGNSAFRRVHPYFPVSSVWYFPGGCLHEDHLITIRQGMQA